MVKVNYGPLVLVQSNLEDSPEKVGIGKLWIETYRFVKVNHSPLVLAQFLVEAGPEKVDKGVLWIDTDGLVEILDGLLELT